MLAQEQWKSWAPQTEPCTYLGLYYGSYITISEDVFIAQHMVLGKQTDCFSLTKLCAQEVAFNRLQFYEEGASAKLIELAACLRDLERRRLPKSRSHAQEREGPTDLARAEFAGAVWQRYR